jgi:hypothetical protein
MMISLEEGLSWCSLVGCTRESTSQCGKELRCKGAMLWQRYKFTTWWEMSLRLRICWILSTVASRPAMLADAVQMGRASGAAIGSAYATGSSSSENAEEGN